MSVSFEIKNKIALITGGASGIGFEYAKALLKEGLRGVTLADINSEFGERALKEIETKFGSSKAIFIRTDVTDKKSFEDAFEKTVTVFGNIDILINNAGILDDRIWEREVAINVNGTIHGMLLGLDNYLPKYKSDSEAVIVNISSIAGVKGAGVHPVYTATKFAVTGLSQAWGDEFHYNRTKVRVLALCPSITETPLMADVYDKAISDDYRRPVDKAFFALLQKPESVASAMLWIVKNAKPGTIWMVENGMEPYEFHLPHYRTFAPQ